MACSQEFIDYVCEEVGSVGRVRYRRMFGACMVYIDEKAVILIVDDVAYIRMHPSIDEWMQGEKRGYPYDGAKERYILDFFKPSLVRKALSALVNVLPYPKKKKHKKGE